MVLRFNVHRLCVRVLMTLFCACLFVCVGDALETEIIVYSFSLSE